MRTAVEIQNTFNLAMFDGEETGLYYYGARYYNPRISLWYGVDPLNEERYGLSPYQYCQNNPVILVDPTGLLDDGYTIDDKGNIERVDNTGGENYDVLYLKQEYEMNLENEMNNNPLEYNEPYNKAEVSKGTFSQENIFSLGRTKGVKVTNEDDAKAIYNLVKESSSVEFGIVSGDNNGYMSIIASSGDRGEVDVPRIAQYMIKNGFFILETSHNHPGDTPNTFFPSGFENGKPILPLKHDAEAADWMDKKNGAPIKHYMYHPHSGKTYQYNHRTYVER